MGVANINKLPSLLQQDFIYHGEMFGIIRVGQLFELSNPLELSSKHLPSQLWGIIKDPTVLLDTDKPPSLVRFQE